MHYFRQINEHLDNKHFAFFVLVRGRQPGIYCQWKEVVDLMINYPDPYVKRFLHIS